MTLTSKSRCKEMILPEHTQTGKMLWVGLEKFSLLMVTTQLGRVSGHHRTVLLRR
jgi:hypothetical protein